MSNPPLSADEVAGVETLLGAFDGPRNDAAFCDLVMGYGLPNYPGTADEPYRRILRALQDADRLNRNVPRLREKVAERLTFLLDSRWCYGPDEPDPARVLFNVYMLAGNLGCPDGLIDALVREVDRQERWRQGKEPPPRVEADLTYTAGPVRRFLFGAVARNQLDQRFAPLWLDALSDFRAQPGGMRDFWGVHWSQAFQALCLVRNKQRWGVAPPLATLARALPSLARSLEYEYPDDPAAQVHRFWQNLERFRLTWRLKLPHVLFLLPYIRAVADHGAADLRLRLPSWCFGIDRRLEVFVLGNATALHNLTTRVIASLAEQDGNPADLLDDQCFQQNFLRGSNDWAAAKDNDIWKRELIALRDFLAQPVSLPAELVENRTSPDGPEVQAIRYTAVRSAYTLPELQVA